MNITEKEQRMLIRRVSEAIICIQDGENAVDVLSSIYCKNLPDKTTFQGELMANNLIQWMNAFFDGYDEALDQPEEYLDKCLDAALVDLSEKQREEEKARFFQALEEQPDVLDCEEGLSIERLWARQQIGDEMVLVVTTMVLYTMAKNGELSGLSRETTLAQVTLCTCAENVKAERNFDREFATVEELNAQAKGLKSLFYGLMISAAAVSGACLTTGLVSLVSVSVGILAWVSSVTGFAYNVFGIMSSDEEMPEMKVLNSELSEEDIDAIIQQKTQINRKSEYIAETHSNPQKKMQTDSQPQKSKT